MKKIIINQKVYIFLLFLIFNNSFSILKDYTNQFPNLDTNLNELVSHKAVIHMAVLKNDIQTIQELIDKKVNINQIDINGTTPLMYACHFGFTEIAKLLLNNGADKYLKNKNGDTALSLTNKKNVELINLLNASNNIETFADFNSIWLYVQSKYRNLNTIFPSRNYEKVYFNSFWLQVCQDVGKMLLDKSNIKFLYHSGIGSTMVRNDYGAPQIFEECFLQYCLSENIRNKIAQFKDNDNNLLEKKVASFNCSVNTLGHLYYTGRVSQHIDLSNKTIVEFGGGYGNLSRIIKTLFPDSTIFIFDFPEFSSIQYLFLKYVMPNTRVIIHDKILSENYKGAINLIPVYLMDQFNIKADLFISTFALTESPAFVQNIVFNKKFFNADMCYIAGQLNGWAEMEMNWMTDHRALMNALRNQYPNIDCIPFHIFAGNMKNFELTAKK